MQNHSTSHANPGQEFSIRLAIQEVLQVSGEMTTPAVAELCGVSQKDHDFQAAMRRLHAEGAIERLCNGWKNVVAVDIPMF